MIKQIIVILLALIWTNSFAIDGQSSTGNGWNFMIAPYAWITWTNGNISTTNFDSSLNLTPQDIKNVLDSALMLHLEASKLKWTFIVDSVYFKLSKELSTAKFTFRQTTIDLGGFYQLMNQPFRMNRLTGQIYLGGRYWQMNTELSTLINQTQQWLDPIIGGRFVYHMRDKWQLIGYGDIGGFGWVSHFTWQLKALAFYKFNRYIGLSAGFRALKVNYSTGSNNTRFKYDAVTYGPLIGLIVTF